MSVYKRSRISSACLIFLYNVQFPVTAIKITSREKALHLPRNQRLKDNIKASEKQTIPRVLIISEASLKAISQRLYRHLMEIRPGLPNFMNFVRKVLKELN